MFEGISLCFDSCDMYLLNMQSRNFILHAVPEAMSCFVGGIDQRKEIKKKHGFCKENTLSKLYNLMRHFLALFNGWHPSQSSNEF